MAPQEQVVDPYGHMDTLALHALLNAKYISFVLADARTALFDDGDRIPGAVSLPSNSTPDAIDAAIPDKATLVVVYCNGLKCPASKKLADRLVSLGYQNVIKNPEGLDGWEAAGFPIIHPENAN
jgi:rhodanese-related sulfurtransferase